MRYAIVIEKAAENYSAYAADRPGCVAIGATIDEVDRDMVDAIQFHLDGLREDGIRPAPPTGVVAYIDACQVSAVIAASAKQPSP